MQKNLRFQSSNFRMKSLKSAKGGKKIKGEKTEFRRQRTEGRRQKPVEADKCLVKWEESEFQISKKITEFS